MTVRLRAGGPEDAAAIGAVRDAGFATYGQWAQPGWEPPVTDGPELERLRTELARANVWCLVAEAASGELEGFVAFKPLLTEWLTGDPVPGTAHLWMLFVAPDAWRRGIGRRLHDAAVAEMRAQGFELLLYELDL